MTRFLCIFCGESFDKEDVSIPMKNSPGWVWMRDSCPKCHRGMDNWYISDILRDMYFNQILKRAIRYCKVVKNETKNEDRE